MRKTGKYPFTEREDANSSIDSIIINGGEMMSYLEVGKSIQLSATVFPESENKNIVWKTSNPLDVLVTSDGIITALHNGGAVITASVDGKTASYIVMVADNTVVEVPHTYDD
jgi:uncharacterized protein YjdB